MESYGIDGHKLHLHPQRVAKWLQGDNIYPIYMEVSPSGSCNHRCVFCTMDFMGYKPRFLDTEMLCQRLRECGALGVKSVMFAGEGEPLLHRDIAHIAETAKSAGIDVSFTTNGVLLKEDLAAHLLSVTSWIKVSCNAGTPESYSAIHRTQAEDFERVMDNMAHAAALRARERLACTLGFQCVLLPENVEGLPELARRARELGADYLVVKPYTRNPKSLASNYDDIHYNKYRNLAERLADEERKDFRVIFRNGAMRRWDLRQSAFERCLALPFWVYVDAGANVWGCFRHLGEESFRYGNIMEASFSDIWQGERCRSNMKYCAEEIDVSQCHVTCRMELINIYLWRLRHPEAHDNFI